MTTFSFDNFFVYHRCSRFDIPYALYPFHELYKLHRNFGNPSTNSLANLLGKADPERFCNINQTLEDIRSEIKV